MKAKKLIFAVGAAVVCGAAMTYIFADTIVEPRNPREPASVPNGYEDLKGCEKLDILWQKTQSTVHQQLPGLRDFGVFQLIALGKQEISIKGSNLSDFAPAGWKKLIHGRGAMAKVKIVPVGGAYSGIFQGADCALLRLSVTFKPGGLKGFAPGLALKILRDGAPSANVSALVSLDGQGKDYDFFKYPMSNVVPASSGWGAKIIHQIFSGATKFPEELVVDDMAAIDAHGAKSATVSSPRQLFFVPGQGLKAASEPHDPREDFLKIPAGTVIYHIRAVSDQRRAFDYGAYKPETVTQFLKDSAAVADVVTTSEFLASEFGDDGIFFRHQLRPK